MPASRSTAAPAEISIGSSGAGAGDAAERNIISGNSFAGVWMTGTGTDNNAVAGNYIGTNVTGTIALGNGSVFQFSGEGDVDGGVLIDDGASDNLIGTSGHSADDAGQRKSSPAVAAMASTSTAAEPTGNVVAGNFIGTDAAGTAGLGSVGDGVVVTTMLRATGSASTPSPEARKMPTRETSSRATATLGSSSAMAAREPWWPAT